MDAQTATAQGHGVLSRSPSAPFPLEAVRDLLGCARALYAARRADGARGAALARIERVGTDLRIALELASTSPATSVGMRAAWARAERGTRELGELVKANEAAEPIMLAAVARMRR